MSRDVIHYAVIGALAAAVAIFIAELFVHNLPLWCATPHIGGNWIVQPFCTKEQS